KREPGTEVRAGFVRSLAGLAEAGLQAAPRGLAHRRRVDRLQEEQGVTEVVFADRVFPGQPPRAAVDARAGIGESVRQAARVAGVLSVERQAAGARPLQVEPEIVA